ncbi:phospholipase [Micromonospora sp. NPDC049559]|uniref:alpha/beta hydrolase n=1 Tax=Micromonospora sp. NPDC049559 TaxID=3155923 RepID=UPI0034421B97
MAYPEVPAHARHGRLRLPPGRSEGSTAPPGRGEVRVAGEVVGLLHAPPGLPERLVVLFHGSGGSAEDGLRLLAGHADERHLLLFAPQSVGRTWDVVDPGFGPDVVRVDTALRDLLDRYALARPDLAVGGFSDGASYALSLGLGNGDVFGAVLAFSPGFAAPGASVGTPACFVSHGRADAILPIDLCSRRLVPVLERAGYAVRYREFDGGHEVPPDVLREALDWLAEN